MEVVGGPGPQLSCSASQRNVLQSSSGSSPLDTMRILFSLAALALLSFAPTLASASQCPAGSYSSTGQGPSCTACAAGFYQNGKRAISALAQPAGQLTHVSLSSTRPDFVPRRPVRQLRARPRLGWHGRDCADCVLPGDVPAQHGPVVVLALSCGLVLQRRRPAHPRPLPARPLLGHARHRTGVSPLSRWTVPAQQRSNVLLPLVSERDRGCWCQELS